MEEKEYKSEFARIFLPALKLIKKTQKEVSNELGFKDAALSYQLSGEKKLSREKILKIVNYFNCCLPYRAKKINADEWLSSCGFMREEVEEAYHEHPKAGARAILKLKR